MSGMEFEPSVVATRPMIHHQENFFLMPVQGWFALTIIFAAVIIVLLVILGLLFRSLRSKKTKVITFLKVPLQDGRSYEKKASYPKKLQEKVSQWLIVVSGVINNISKVHQNLITENVKFQDGCR